MDGGKRNIMTHKNANRRNTFALLDRLRAELPGLWGQAQVVGKWVWLEFNIPPLRGLRSRLRSLGFRWNGVRSCWQHPCGIGQARASGKPGVFYPAASAGAMAFKEAASTPTVATAKEYKIVALRECPLPEQMLICDTPQKVADYWRLNVETNPYYNPECECFVVLMLNTRRRAKGHQLVTIGTLDTILVHPREVFRGAIIASAAAIVLIHNHPSGEPQPSEADIKVTRDLVRAGQLLKLEVLDHVIVGKTNYSSLRELGYFYT